MINEYLNWNETIFRVNLILMAHFIHLGNRHNL